MDRQDRRPMVNVIFSELWSFRSTIILIATPLLLAIMLPLYDQMGLTQEACNCLYMLLLMAVYWCTEVIPLAVTSLIPLIAAPMLSILPLDEVAGKYITDLNVMFMGGLMVAVVIEHSGLHRRIALGVLKRVGTNPRLLMLGFMIPTWFLSMWISNTATTAMMIAIVQAVVNQLQSDDLNPTHMSDPRDMELNAINGKNNHAYEPNNDNNATKIAMNEKEELDGDTEETDSEPTEEIESEPTVDKWQKTTKALSLCICYAATSGGIATLTGTAPNLVLVSNIKRVSKELSAVSNVTYNVDFPTWMGFGIPVSLTMMLISWLWLQVVFIGFRGKKQSDEETLKIKTVIDNEYKKLGSIQWKEVIALIHFVVLALLWITRNPGNVGGWGSAFKKDYVDDGSAAILVATIAFMMPSEKPDFCCLRGGCGKPAGHKPKPRKPLVTWNDVSSRVPWGLILLLGGGFALAKCIEESKLSNAIGDSLTFFNGWPLWGIVMCLSAITASITEFTSNTAITTIFLPIVSALAIKQGIHPLYLMLPVTASASFAFMLPVATPPNALVFATGVLKITDMMKTGLALNVVGVCLSTLATLTWGAAIFNLDDYVAHVATNTTTGI